MKELLDSLGRSKFRGSFHLNSKMKRYVLEKGMDKIQKDAYEIIESRIGDAAPKNDGKQTPMKQVHPVFIAQHACGCCCRGCLERIHHIKKGKKLSKEELDYLVQLILLWIQREMERKI